jgi:hypothetical protein
MQFITLAIFIAVWIAVVIGYRKRGIKGIRPQVFGFLTGLATLLLIGASAGIIGATKVPGRIASTAPAAAPRATPDDDFVSARAITLFTEYDENEVAADRKYKGKEVVLTGPIQSIERDAFRNIVVHLQTPNQFMSVLATLQDKYESEAARMKKGDIVSLDCIGAGRVMGSPVLKNCRPLAASPTSEKKKKI